MITKITENEIELFAIELLEKQGFEYIYAPNIAPDSDTPMRDVNRGVKIGSMKAA